MLPVKHDHCYVSSKSGIKHAVLLASQMTSNGENERKREAKSRWIVQTRTRSAAITSPSLPIYDFGLDLLEHEKKS